MGKMHLSQNFVSFEVYYIVKLFLLQGRHGSESTSDEARTGQMQEQQNDGWEFDCRNKLEDDSESYFGNKLTRPSPGPPY